MDRDRGVSLPSRLPARSLWNDGSRLVGIQRGNVAKSVAVDLMKPNITLGALGCRLSAAMVMPACAADDVIADRSFACENAYRLASGAAIAKAVPVIINALFAK
jgi:hypothetical protein